MIQTIPLIGISIWFIVKIFFLVGIGVYVLFSIVVFRQVQLMTSTLSVGFETPVKLLALMHIVVAILVFIFALTTL